MKRPLLALFAVCIISHGFAQSFLSTKGKAIITSEGKAFLIKGINLGNWLVPEGYMFHFDKATSPRLINETITELIGPFEAEKFWQDYVKSYITHADIRYLKSIGVNSIRLPFNYRMFTAENYLGCNTIKKAFDIMDSLIQWCKEDTIYVLLDMHCAPGGQTGDNIDDSYGYPFLYDSKKAQELTLAIWKEIAAHYAKEAIVMGYDLLNEPIPPFYDTAYLNPKLEPLYKRIASAIRSVDKKHILFLGGAQWDSNFDIFGKPFDKNLVYTFHKYWTPPTKLVVQPYINFSNRWNVPVYCGETGENTDEWIQTFRLMLDSNAIGWHFWPYKKMNNTRCLVSFPEPFLYHVISAYADTARGSFKEIQQRRPANTGDVRKALADFIDNCRFEHCLPNEGYARALGLRP